MVTKRADWTPLSHVWFHHPHMFSFQNGMRHFSYSCLVCFWWEESRKGKKKSFGFLLISRVQNKLEVSDVFSPFIYMYVYKYLWWKKVTEFLCCMLWWDSKAVIDAATYVCSFSIEMIQNLIWWHWAQVTENVL